MSYDRNSIFAKNNLPQFCFKMRENEREKGLVLNLGIDSSRLVGKAKKNFGKNKINFFFKNGKIYCPFFLFFDTSAK